MIESTNPKNGKTIKTYEKLSDKESLEKLDKAHKRFQSWQKTSFEDRSKLFTSLADELEKNKKEWSKLMTDEMGKPIDQAESEIEKCQWVCRFYSENAKSFLETDSIDADYKKSHVAFRPLGVILAVMPWNFPFWQVFRFAAPSIMAGNTAVLKHASNVPGCSLAIEEAFSKAGFPEGVFQSLLIDQDQTSKLIAHDQVRAVTLTGSTAAGKKVASLAGENLKKTVLELGGSDAYLVLADADVDLAVEKCTQSRLLNSGQSCIAAKRFIVHKSLVEEFSEKMKKSFEKKKWGDPMETGQDLGPMARADLRDELHEQVKKSIEKGAHCLTGGEIPDKDGAFYPPTVLKDVKPGQPAFDEELFGPVAAIISFDSVDEAIALSNQSKFGLGGGIFSKDEDKAYKIAVESLDTGSVFINDFVKSDPRLPFGGVKQSGYGRELSYFGIKEFVNTKTVCVKS